MVAVQTKVQEIFDCEPNAIPESVLTSDVPLVLKGLVKAWPLVQAGLQSPAAADSYLRGFYTNRTVGAYFGPPEVDGRLFYSNDMMSMNFESHYLKLDAILEKMASHRDEQTPPTIYVGSTTVDICLPGFREQNDVAVPHQNPLVSIWISNKARIACHYDGPDNLACVAVGRRRFTVFPPEQISNLYPGPVDLTPAGQVISLVDFENPDFEKFPRFREAIKHGLVAEMEAGDALFLPRLWWHQVESLSNFNVLVNYWWRSVPTYMEPVINVLKHAMLSVRDLPENEKAAWKAIFDYYIFGDPDVPRENIPEAAQGFLAPMTDLSSRQMRAFLISKLNR